MMTVIEPTFGEMMNPMTPEPAKALPEYLRDDLTFLLDRLSSDISDRAADKLKRFNLGPRLYFLLCILQSGNSNQQDLADLIRVNRNAMVQLIDSLEQLGLGERTVNQQNRREHIVKLTDKGRKVCDQARKVMEQVYHDSYDRLKENRAADRLLGALRDLIVL